MKRKILITWWTGYIWSHTVVEFLENWFEIIIIDDFSNSKEDVLEKIFLLTGFRPKFYNIDLKNKIDLKKVFKKIKLIE